MKRAGKRRSGRRKKIDIPVAAWTAAGALFLVALTAPLAEPAAQSVLAEVVGKAQNAEALLEKELRASALISGGQTTQVKRQKTIEVMDIDADPAAGNDGDGAEERDGEKEAAASPSEESETVESWADPKEILSILSVKPISAITIAPQESKGYATFGGIYIKNNTDYALDIEKSLKKPLAFSLSGKGPQVLILHTHGSEAYTEEDRDYYLKEENNRSTDPQKNVTAVGEKLAEELKKRGIDVVHLTELFDYPEYNGAYNRALDAIGQAMKENPSIKVVIDLHRDAMETESGVKYKTVAEINGRLAAQIMLVCGSDAGGLPNSEWAKNLRFSIRLQQQMNEAYPGLMRPISLRKERFNQHVTKGGSLLIEMGTSGNTLEEALYSAELLGEKLGAVLLSAAK